ncbi:FecR domain-containing protein [uncultured Parabacteroides sp.]|uniref:FecR family protein n=1 Tax=uncultured Parabacteroides sp. TaxID=512312 RepID=UPI00262F3E91|nr:FecR domain-containing protein [uncultured Parabacteroides sp.]
MAENNTYIDLLDRFMSGSTSPEEEKELLEWFRNVRSKDEIFSFYKRKWEEVSGKELSADIQGQMFHKIKRRMETTTAAGKEAEVKELPYKKYLGKWWSYVAVILLCVSLGIGSHLYTRDIGGSQQEYIVSAEKGQRASLTLPDGTRVWLNSHTHITYNGNYGKDERAVYLSGEAYFEVAKDKKHRFVVKAGDLEVEALGTAFNVKAYDEDKELTATLFEGSIRAVVGNEMAILSPDQHVRFNKVSRRLLVERPTNSSYARMWRNDELAFESETLENIAVLLNRMYNVQVKFASEKIKRYRFSGVIKNNSLDNIFEIISLTAPILYGAEGDTITLREK